MRVVWLLEELGAAYELKLVEFKPTTSEFFIQQTPTGKLPTLVDGDTVMCESGAIIEYLLETLGQHDLAPAIGHADRAGYLQWLHFAEGTAFGPLGIVVWLTLYRQDAAEHPELVADAVARAGTGLAYLERHLATQPDAVPYLLPCGFSAADIMMGFTLFAAQQLQQLNDKPSCAAYLNRLGERPALQTALAKLGGF